MNRHFCERTHEWATLRAWSIGSYARDFLPPQGRPRRREDNITLKYGMKSAYVNRG